ncbi:hypothetical protein WKY82_02970 [Gordonia malaquae]|uniref:hypothetical protein n=1 Tax=Gordonia malaquae TaxID=410332 RepID=UPI0030C79398
MADEAEPESKPITVSELIARSGGDDAFPRSESVSVRRPGSDTSGTTSSGMPSYTAPTKRSAADAPRSVGASGMPGYTPPSTPSEPESNDVTGVIPVVFDDADTGSLRKVEADDVFDYDLPPAVIHTSAVDSYGTADAVEDTTSIPLVDDFVDADADEPADASDESNLDDDAHDVADQILDDSDEAAEAKAAKADEKAAKKAAKAEAKAARAAEREDSEPSAAAGWAAFAGEIVLGLGVGAGLFWGFTELWKKYVYLALVLAIVVIFAIVTFAHVLRKRDLPTTLLALAVGMLVTIGPLVFLAAQP